MSLSSFTKCDLSAGIAKLDITELYEQLQRRLYNLTTLAKAKLEIQVTALPTVKDTDKFAADFCCTGARCIKQLVYDIERTAELLHTIAETQDREIICINLLKEE